MKEDLRQAGTWLKLAIERASLEAEGGAFYSNFGFDDDTPKGVESVIMSHSHLRRTYEYAESYFLALAHRDPDHSGTPWTEAKRLLDTMLEAVPMDR